MNIDLFNYKRRQSSVTHVGNVPMGGDNPIRLQSMTTTPTTDTEGCVAQAERIIKAGGEYVRLTTQGVREAENMRNISQRLRADGYSTPLVADVHFNPKVADVAALYAEKVRINPGNYVDPARTFRHIEYTDEEYADELHKIEQRFVPFLNICKEHHRAVRIGVNHGSLSDRIMSRYGDTPRGIVESCMEFLRICQKEHFSNVVISIKASNTVVMVRSVRLLVEEMDREGMSFPLHLGVTEAGEGEDGRIKSAVGIGALLADGIGDTVRVSLSEDPEAEIPVARHLVDYVMRRAGHEAIKARHSPLFNWLNPERRATRQVDSIGGDTAPIVIADGNEMAHYGDLRPDFVYVGSSPISNIVATQKYIVDASSYKGGANTCPLFRPKEIDAIDRCEATLKFLLMDYSDINEDVVECLRHHNEIVVISDSRHQNRLGANRALAMALMNSGVHSPIVFRQCYSHTKAEKGDFQLEAAIDMGALMVDGLTDGIWLSCEGDLSPADIVDTSFAILQAARLRTTKTEYISCPGCGRTLYDLRSAIARIKAATQGMTGLKIGIMGCIVNGPGEMADADYGYVGAGRGKISLYRKKECVAKNIPEEEAVERLLQLINSENTPKK